MFPVLFCTLWCQAQLQQGSELRGVAGYKATKMWKCLWETSDTDCIEIERQYQILGNMYLYTYIYCLYLLRNKYKREQYLPILLWPACYRYLFLSTCILTYIFSRYYSCILSISFTKSFMFEDANKAECVLPDCCKLYGITTQTQGFTSSASCQFCLRFLHNNKLAVGYLRS